MIEVRWECVLGADLADPTQAAEALEDIPRLPGVYMWRRCLETDFGTVRDYGRCMTWIERVVAARQARVTSRNITPHVILDGAAIGGGELTAEKSELLRRLVRHPSSRELLCSAIVSLQSFLPPLYVGRTDDLRARTRDHLREDTGLYDYVRGALGLGWEDVSLWFLAVRAPAAKQSEVGAFIDLLEYVAQKVLAPFAVERCG